MIKKSFLRTGVTALILCLIMTLCPAMPAYAGSGDGSFCLYVATTSETVIPPVRVSYSAGQTIREALDQTDYGFVNHGAFIDVINGVEGGYEILYDGGGYDLTQPADTITAIIISENQQKGTEHLDLLRYMLDYADMTNNVQNYPAAAEAFNRCDSVLRTGNTEAASAALSELTAAVAEYEGILNGTKYQVTVSAEQNGSAVSSPVITLTDAYGNVTVSAGNTAAVVKGDYTVSVSDGGWNRTERAVTVSGNTALSFDLPYGEWFGEINMLDQKTREPYEKEQSDAEHLLTVQVPDTAGLSNPIINAAQGSVPDTEKTKLYGVYIGTDGKDYSGYSRSWNSSSASFPKIFGQGMEGRTFTLEARYSPDDVDTMIQSYTVIVDRFPTLKELSVMEENTLLPLQFDPVERNYSVTTTAGSLTISATAFDEGYTVSGTGTVSVPGNTTKFVTVSSGGKTSQYSISIEKKQAANVSVTAPQGTEVSVFNSADSEIRPVNNVYHLVPGEEYYYIATKNTYYHTRSSFTAADGQTVNAAAPETVDKLSDFALYNVSSQTTRKKYDFDEEFSPSGHDLACTIPDTQSIAYAQATVGSDYSAAALYYRQTTNESTNGTYQTVAIKNAVGASAASALTGCLIAGGYSQNAVIRLSKTAGTVTYYQDYDLFIRRSEHLKSLSVFYGTAELGLQDQNGQARAFNRDILDYWMTVDRGTQSLKLSGTFTNESEATSVCGGYHAMVNGVRYDKLSDVQIDLDQDVPTELIEIKVCHEDENAVETVYTLTVKKTDPVDVTFVTEPEDATVFIVSNSTGKRVQGSGKTFGLIPGQIYTYNVTANGYVGVQNANYAAPAEAATVSVELTEAEESPGLPDYDAYWPSTRFDEYNNGTTDAKTPVTAEGTALYWATKLGEGYSSNASGCPIIVNDCIYTYAANKIYKLDKISGEVIAEGVMDHSSSFAINSPTYADGMIFMGLADGTVQAFNADTLESLWIYHDALKGQPDCPIAYHDGYIYTGFWNGESTAADFVCLSVTDEDPAASKEEKLPSWTYSSKGGFYWAGAYVSDDYLLVGTDDGKPGYTDGYASVLSLDPKTGELLDSYTMTSPGDLRSGITFVPGSDGGGRGYFTSKGGHFYRVDVLSDGSFAEGSLKKIRLNNFSSDTNNPGMSTSTPAIYNGRAYVGVCGTSHFGQYSGHNITVIDLDAWSIAYTVPTQGFPQTSGLVTTAYEQENGSVCVYFFDNYTPGKLRMITDKPGQTSAAPITVEQYTSYGNTETFNTGYVLFTPYSDQAQYCICSPIVDEDGTIYFKNDSAYLMALGSNITELAVDKQPDKTTYVPGEVFDPAGMKITAKYANGTEKDVTAYAKWSEEPLTERDTQFEIYFPHVMYHDDNGRPGTPVQEPFASITLAFTDENGVTYVWADDNSTCTAVFSAEGEEEVTETVETTAETTEATCTEAGQTVYTAEFTNEKFEKQTKTVIIDALGHDWDEGTVTKEATPEEEGEMTFTCNRCGETKTEVIPKTEPAHKPGWAYEDGAWYYYNQDGTMATDTWKKDSHGWCYLGADGRMVTNGWAKDSKGYCWMGSDGYMVEKTQWLKTDGSWYHITKGYRDENKWMKDSKGWCYLGADGRMVTNGWAKDSKGYCWMGSDGYMVEQTKWIKYDGGWYYIEKGYRVQNKWKKDSKGWCYLGADGRMVTNGWAKDSKGYCWMGSDGYMVEQTKWIKYDGGWYYIEKGYRVQNKWKKDSNGWCYLGSDGRMVANGWAKDSKGYCWMGPDGYMVEQTMLVEYQGDTYYIIDGYMQTNCTVVIDGETYVFGEDGKRIN